MRTAARNGPQRRRQLCVTAECPTCTGSACRAAARGDRDVQELRRPECDDCDSSDGFCLRVIAAAADAAAKPASSVAASSQTSELQREQAHEPAAAKAA